MKSIDKAGEEVVIMAVREALPVPFEATDWTDLRVGFFLSICRAADPGGDDLITTLTETIGTEPRPFLPWTDRVAIGLTGGTGRHDYVFLGFTNAFRGRTNPSAGSSKLVSGDAGVGTTNNNYWRFKNELSNDLTLQIIQNDVTRAASVDGAQVHFAQANIGAGGPAGYATCLMLRFTRPDARGRSKVITMQCKTSASHSADVVFSSTPTKETLTANLEAFPTTVQTLGPVELSFVPDTIYYYWPFRLSRLRIHAHGIVKAN